MQKAKQKKVGFIGLGTMGKPMAMNIARAGFPLTVYDLRKEILTELEKMGAKVARSPQEVGEQSDIVVVMVLNYPQIKEAAFPSAGVLSGMRGGSTIIVTSTISPRQIQEVAKVAGQSGVAVIDSPVSGGPERAKTGTLTLMVGADADVLKGSEDVLKAMGNIHHVGKVGQGQAVKMINQLLVAANIVSVAEAMVMAKKLDMNLPALVDMISKSTGDSWALRTVAPRMIAGNFEAVGAVNTMTKDTRIIMETAMELEVPAFISSIPYQLYRMLESRGFSKQDISSVVTIFEEYAGVRVCDP